MELKEWSYSRITKPVNFATLLVLPTPRRHEGTKEHEELKVRIFRQPICLLLPFVNLCVFTSLRGIKQERG